MIEVQSNSNIQKHHLPSHFCILDEFVNKNPTALIPVLDSYIHSDRRPDALYFNSIAATVHAYEMGQRAVELLMNQIKPEEFPAVDNNVPYTFIEREST